MKKLFPEASNVPRSVANRAARIVERHFRKHGGDRARDLSEEAKVRLYCDLRWFFDNNGTVAAINRMEIPADAIARIKARLVGVRDKIEDFLSL